MAKKDKTAVAARERVIQELGIEALGDIDLMKVKNDHMADVVIARARRQTFGAELCQTQTGTLTHYARDSHKTLCGFRNAGSTEPNGLGVCKMCVEIYAREVQSS